MVQPSSPHITIHNAYLAYDNFILFDDLNLTVPAGECTCLLGHSGVGKSTLLKLIANLVDNNKKTQCHASIYFNDQQKTAGSVSYMAQSDSLLPWLNALDNTLIGTRLRGGPTKHIKDHAIELFHHVGLKQAEFKYPHELSGGMRQRVALIRTILENKPVVLMDEPFSALDAITRYELQDLAVDLFRDRTLLVVTHDPLEALRIANRIIIMSGQPVKLDTMTLGSPTPRKLSDPDVIKNQEILFETLLQVRKQ